jgi:hypothetical protein
MYVWDKAVPSLGSRSSSLLDRMNLCRLCRFGRPLPAESRTLLVSRTVPFHVEIQLCTLCVALYVCVSVPIVIPKVVGWASSGLQPPLFTFYGDVWKGGRHLVRRGDRYGENP